MSSSYASLLVSLHDDILLLTLNRPGTLNLLNPDMVSALKSQLTEVSQNPEIRAVILTGSGAAFCAGSDFKVAVELNPDFPGDSFLASTGKLHECVKLIRTMSKPVIAQINGVAAGAGLFLALACDLRVMAETAYLEQLNTSYGLSLLMGGTFTLPRLIGMGRALELVMLDEPIAAAQALDWGLVSQVVSEDHLHAETLALADRVAQMPIGTLGRVKRLMNEAFNTNLSDQLTAERQQIAMSANSKEGREGLSAFLQKRRPEFSAVRVQ